MKPTILILIISLLFSFIIEKKAYQMYDQNGSQVDYSDLLQEAMESDVILFGEIHDNPILHWLQLELTKDLYVSIKGNLVLGGEMYEADDQLILNEYLQGKYAYKTLNKEAKLWPNDHTDYRPILDYAKENEIPFVATNIPRRYANLVYKYGYMTLDSLTEEALAYIAPIPFPYPDSLQAYQSMMEMAGGHGGENFPKSQAIKDATMAHFIAENWEKGKMFLHFNGSYHSDNFESIGWYLKHHNPKLKVLTISAAEQDEIKKLEDEYVGVANYVISIPSNMTKTF